MKKNIEITIKKDKVGVLFNKTDNIELSENNNVNELISKIKSTIPLLSGVEIVKEELFYGTQLMKIDESVPAKNGIELEITIK